MTSCVILKDKINQDILIDSKLKILDVKQVRLYGDLMKGYIQMSGIKTRVYKLLSSICWTTYNPLIT